VSTDAETIRRAAGGDADAFAGLIGERWAFLVRFARSLVGDAEAEDAVQEGVLRAWRRLPTLRRPEAFGVWLTRVVARTSLRRARRRAAAVGLLPLAAAPEPRSDPDPGGELDVELLLGALAPRQRAVMHLTVVEGMSDGEIAKALGITAAGVRSHRRRARGRLQRALEGGARR
jgi:RNA polymerase sigma-70 factor (ECF subfamily)